MFIILAFDDRAAELGLNSTCAHLMFSWSFRSNCLRYGIALVMVLTMLVEDAVHLPPPIRMHG